MRPTPSRALASRAAQPYEVLLTRIALVVGAALLLASIGLLTARTARANDADAVLYGAREHLPVRAAGSRYMSGPHGDADLIGFPVRVVVGKRGLAEGNVEISLRRDRERRDTPKEAAVATVHELLAELRDEVE